MLASWVQQCSFDPPRVSVALAQNRWSLSWLTPGAPFTVNVIPEGDKTLIVHFGKGFGPGEPAFSGLEVIREVDRAPALSAAHASIGCQVEAQHEVGDHVLVIGTVVAGAVLSDARPATHVRKSGGRY